MVLSLGWGLSCVRGHDVDMQVECAGCGLIVSHAPAAVHTGWRSEATGGTLCAGPTSAPSCRSYVLTPQPFPAPFLPPGDPKGGGDVRRFLNRLLGLRVEHQVRVVRRMGYLHGHWSESEAKAGGARDQGRVNGPRQLGGRVR